MKFAEITGAAVASGSARANVRFGRLLGPLLLAATLPMTATAQVSREQEWGTRVQERENVAALTSAVFGDKINLVDGKGAFAVTDVSIPGNSSLPVAVSRKIELGSAAGFTAEEMFGDWAIDLPYLAGAHGNDPSTYWANPLDSANGLKRCSVGIDPQTGTNRLVLPGGGGGSLLKRTDTSKHVLPQIQGLSPWVTKDNWYFTCLSAIKNGNGEGFVGISPDGVRYTFDWMSVHFYPGTSMPALGVGEIQINRKEIRLNLTRVEDRFGNWVNYNWTPQGLASIESNDGRRIDFYYEANNVKRVRANGQDYTYVYATEQALTDVINPDQSRWHYDQQVPSLIPYKEEMETYNCRKVGDAGVQCDYRIKKEQVAFCSWSDYIVVNDYVFAITAPSGATGSFKFRPMRHGRAWTPRDCQFPEYENSGGTHWAGRPWNRYQAYYDAFTLVEKQISGPGLTPQTWSYTYSGEEPSFVPTPSSGETYSPHYKTVSVLNPDGSKVVSTFGKDYGINEGQLAAVEVYDASNVRKRRTAYTYVSEAQAATAPYPAAMGSVVTYDEDADTWSLTAIRPQQEVVVEQDGVTARSTVNSFDAFAHPLSVTRANASFTRTDVSEYRNDLAKWVLGQPLKLTNIDTSPATEVSKTDYNANGLPWKTYSFGKLQQTLTYNADATLAAVIDGRNNTTTFSSWKRGLPQSILYADTRTESGVVNDDGSVVSVTDENGYKTCYAYDTMGRLTGVTYPSGSQAGVCDTSTWSQTTRAFQPVTADEYGISSGHWKQTVATGNGRKTTYFDALWRPLVTREEDLGNAATIRLSAWRYDADGHVTDAYYPQGNTFTSHAQFTQGTHTTYDALGRVTQVKQDSEFGPLTTTTEYLSGLQTRVTNPRNFATTTGYYFLDQPGYDQPAWVQHPEGAYTDISRDVFGKPTSVVRRNADRSQRVTRSYAYDGYQQLCKTTEPETGATLMGYDAAGNLAWSASGLASTAACEPDGTSATVAARKATRSYDVRNRLATLTFPDGLGNQAWTYTPDGLPEWITAYNAASNGQPVVNAYTYNTRRLLIGESSVSVYPVAWGVGYSYNANGHLQGQSYPTNLYVDYAPNALGQPTKAGTFASGVSYYPNGAIKQFTYGNGIVHSMTQNARQLPQRSSSSNGVRNDVYNYDANGNVESVIDELVGAGNWSPNSRWMTYDGLDRLTGAAAGVFGGTDNWHRYTYDTLDNIKSWKLAGVKDYANYYYDAGNRLTNIQNSANASIVGLGYDAQGNLQNKNGQNYFFDYGNRLRDVVGKETYRYDGYGRRVMADTPNQGYILSMYGQSGPLLYAEDFRPAGRKTSEYVYLGGSLVGVRERNIDTSVYSTKYQHTDALGSPVAVTNESGQVVDRTQWEPYGAAINKPAYQGPGYTGHVMDGATGLTYMQQRYYDPSIGRFLSVDPVTAYENPLGAFNRYWYANNNPYTFTDPDGRKIVFAPGTSSTFKTQFGQVIKYHNKHGTSGVFSRLEKRSEVVTVQEASTQHDFSFNPSNDTITMDLSSGLEVAPGQVQTPALGALHEAGHAEAHLNNPQAEQADYSTPDANYGNKAEKDVIDNVETPAAQKIGEPTRTNHGGTPVQVKCPSCDK